MDINGFREVIKQREETDNEWDYGSEQCWKKEIENLSEDIPSTIEFLKNECTADKYSWISEVIDDVVDIVPSKELVQCYTELMEKFPEYREWGGHFLGLTALVVQENVSPTLFFFWHSTLTLVGGAY